MVPFRADADVAEAREEAVAAAGAPSDPQIAAGVRGEVGAVIAAVGERPARGPLVVREGQAARTRAAPAVVGQVVGGQAPVARVATVVAPGARPEIARPYFDQS